MSGGGDEPTVETQGSQAHSAAGAAATSRKARRKASRAAGNSQEKGILERMRVVGGLLALFAGLFVLLLLGLVAIKGLKDEYATSVVTAAVSSASTMVGAYFGIKIGSDGTKEAHQATKEARASTTEAVKAQEKAATETKGLALATHPNDMEKALDAIAKLRTVTEGPLQTTNPQPQPEQA
jgi:hypothetical protein